MPDNIIEKYLDLTGLQTYDSKIKEVIQKDLTEAWQPNTSYEIGDYVVYNGLLYRCKTAHTSGTAFSATNWDQVQVIDIIGTSFFYRVERLLSFTNGSSLQLENALVAIGSANFFGSGLGKVNIYIPEAPTDFIVAFTISNFGILSIIIILISFLLIDLYLINLYFKTHNKIFTTSHFTRLFYFFH